MDEEKIKEYLELKKQANELWMEIEEGSRENILQLFYITRDIIGNIEKRTNSLWYAGPSTIRLNEKLTLEIGITSYNMGVRKYLKKIKKEIEKWVEKENINYIKGVDVYWKDTLPGKGNLGIRRE